jgi:hypothetical protein
MMPEPGLPHRSGPLAFFLTWTTYGSWLPGDDRGWCDAAGGIRGPNPRLALHASRTLRHSRVDFGPRERCVVEAAVRQHCDFRGWQLHAVSCRTMHVHAAVTARDSSPDAVLASLKAWCSRELSRQAGRRSRWWTRGGSARLLFDTPAVANVVTYVRECQDRPRV